MAATPSITVVPPLPPVLSGRDLARGSPKAKLRSALLAGVTPQHCAFDYLWTFFLGLVSLPGAVRWSGRGYTCLEFSCCAGSSRRIRERPSGTTQT